MHNVKYVITKEKEYYVSQCLNVDVSSFGDTIDQAISNLKEALALYFEGYSKESFLDIQEVMVGESLVNV
jgi:predicted RNase H-like HicB family nuclease